MIFWVKKILAPCLMPLSLCIITLLIGLVFLWFSRKHRAGKIIVSVGTIFLTIFSYGAIADIFLKPLEKEYPPLLTPDQESGFHWVVVMGGGHISDQGLPATGQISDTSLVRLTEGIRIHNSLPESKLIFSGGAVFDRVAEAITMSKVAVAFNLTEQDFVLESASKDTKDQAVNIRKILDNKPFILVTSASHMPRAMAIFRKQGMEPIPAPTDFWVKKRQKINPGLFFPGATGLRKMERAFHEYLGILWAKIRRQI